MFKRVHNPEEVKSNITGFLDEFMALIDRDGDGQVDMREFRPVWEIMRDANLTSSRLNDIDEDWNDFRNIVLANIGGSDQEVITNEIMDLFKSSKWNDPIKFELLGAGKKFSNIIWGHTQVGSLVSTKAWPVQMYLKGYIEDFINGDGVQGNDFLRMSDPPDTMG